MTSASTFPSPPPHSHTRFLSLTTGEVWKCQEVEVEMVQVMAAYVSLRLRMNFPHLFIVLTGKDKAVRVAPRDKKDIQKGESIAVRFVFSFHVNLTSYWTTPSPLRSGERFLTGFLLQLKHVSLWPPFHHEGHTLKRKREL